MKKIIGVLIVSLFIQTEISAQKQATFLAKKLCLELKDLDIERPERIVVRDISKALNKTQRVHNNKFISLKKSIKKKNKKYSDFFIHIYAEKQISKEALKKCTILQSAYEKFDLEKKSIALVAADLCKILENSKSKDVNLSNVINDSIDEIILKHQEKIKAEYNNIESLDFRNDLNENLFNECETYYKWFLGGD